MDNVADRIDLELIHFASDDARTRFDLARVVPQTVSLRDAYGKSIHVQLIAEFGTIKIVYRLPDCAHPWGVLPDGDPIADFTWYRTMWDAFLAAGLWPVPEGYVFD